MAQYTFYAVEKGAGDIQPTFKTTFTFEAASIRQARAISTMKFVEEYPEIDDEACDTVVYETADEAVIVHAAIDTWDAEILNDYGWDFENKRPVKLNSDTNEVDFDKLSKSMQNAVLVKYDSVSITKDMLEDASELLQDQMGTFEGHIVEAINKTPEINAMYPERKLFAIGWVKHKCAPNKKWPEIKAELHNWKKRQDSERKETGPSKSVVDIAREKAATQTIQQTNIAAQAKASGADTDRFDIVLAMLVMGVNPENASASDVKNAKEIIKIRDSHWCAWHETLSEIPGIFTLPESELYSLTIEGMKDLKLAKDDAGRLAYVRERFAGHPLLPDYQVNENDDEQEPQNGPESVADEQEETGTDDPEQSSVEPETTQEEQVERQGPFYFLLADGEKVGRANKITGLDKALADGAKEISQEEYQARKNGTWQSEELPKREDVDKQLAADRGEYIEGISDPEDKNWITEDLTKSPAKNSDALETEQPQAPAPVNDYQGVGASLEKELAEKPDTARENMAIWRSVMRTDPRFTKQMTGTGFEGTSINAEYMIMRATEIFGPIGSRWGYEIQEDRMIPGAPFSEPVYKDDKFVGTRMLRDGDGTLLYEQNHSIRIRLWYQNGDEEGSVIAYGATPYMFKTKNGIKCDGEAQKKSLTDALKKALSLLGFSADVWLGLYDTPEYQIENKQEFDIKNASDKAEDVTRLRNELDEKMSRVANTMEKGVTPNEVKKTFDTIAREVEVHRKAAEAKGDLDHAKYLSGRLRRLAQIKDKRVTELTNQEQSA
ncbi:exodeoxyribonuclease VIII [Klebsiella aerogenes]|uniref:exodeoxyribonuclease VIII n=1 Tax=Klebsiella aerogenes TaxID=548 RepID=UPI000F7DC767|nr:exodeoxyribonuclease VIII [Klebsiella aerogenes]RSV71751.1 exodeoxyribonuclease VIII [Klebsiella aerogenes]RSV73728.1 exodeoxyribonuclease VIII [Klebsiella aerogenes]RSV75775.1 exodeoxyribonuclease VIII [Klebsiella aerogenes]RSW00914.1 exodeoxyribonuclease VIII [Klebsiella aerogenes]RSW02087.1 exodeoxyribonuclease VIII [Klebsiella aerogenes]